MSSAITSVQPPLAPDSRDATKFVVRPDGAHKFAYSEVRSDTGETVWRWPNEPGLARRVEPKGQLLDLVA
jgi:hypothetical protein